MTPEAHNCAVRLGPPRTKDHTVRIENPRGGKLFKLQYGAYLTYMHPGMWVEVEARGPWHALRWGGRTRGWLP